ncbi:hypothetical protein Agub_g9905, partial [Astrephomene gubernaculifera]
LLSSLAARLELLAEEAGRGAAEEEVEGENEAGRAGAAEVPAHPLMCSAAQLAGGCHVALPRRVLMPWLGGGLALCDYLGEGEPAEAAAERAGDLLDMQGAQVHELEQAP